MPTPQAILNQMEANYSRMDDISTALTQSIPAHKQAQLQAEANRIWQAQRYWASEYQKLTGKKLHLVRVEIGPIDYKTDTQVKAEEDARAAESARKADIQKLRNSISETNREYQRIRMLLQDQYDISVTMQNALFSDWVRMGAGLSARHPLIFKKQIEDRAWPKLMDAEKYFNAGKYTKSWEKVVAAAKDVKWGFDCLAWWLERLEVGAKRAEAGIKVTAALAAIIVAAPAAVVVGGATVEGVAVAGVPAMVETGVGTTMLLAGVGEASQQGTILLLNKATGSQDVSLNDLKTAALEVAVSAGSAGVAKGASVLFSKGVAKALSRPILMKILGGAPSAAQLAFFESRIEAYLAANSAAITKKLLKLDKDPDWNWWYQIVMPAFGTTAPELMKEKDLVEAMKERRN